MTRTYALCKLLEHGPMTRREIVECTRWSDREVKVAIMVCQSNSQIRRSGRARLGDRKTATLYRRVGA